MYLGDRFDRDNKLSAVKKATFPLYQIVTPERANLICHIFAVSTKLKMVHEKIFKINAAREVKVIVSTGISMPVPSDKDMEFPTRRAYLWTEKK